MHRTTVIGVTEICPYGCACACGQQGRAVLSLETEVLRQVFAALTQVFRLGCGVEMIQEPHNKLALASEEAIDMVQSSHRHVSTESNWREAMTHSL